MNKLHFLLLVIFISCNSPNCDIVIHNGTIIDGTGNSRFVGTVAIVSDKVVYVGPKKNFSAKKTIDAKNKIVSPGFINMLSWGYNTLLEDGRSLSDLRQGVTLEVFGEGNSPGPVGKIGDEDFIGFGGAMEKLVKSGVSPNIASFLGATNVRKLTVGYENRDATKNELKAAYRTLAKRYHPDTGGNNEKFLTIQIAWETLNDPLKKEKYDKTEDPKIPAHIFALEALKQLDREKVWQSGEVKLYYVRLTEILRKYIERRFFIDALEMTTGEIVEAMEKRKMSEEYIESVKNTLTLADLAKFAKHKPLPDEHANAMTKSVEFVELTKIVVRNAREDK